MNPTPLGALRARAGGAPRAWAALVTLVVLGIVGMHGIGMHGSQHGDPNGSAASSVMAGMTAMTGTAGHGALPGVHAGGHEPGHGMAGMAGLCVAVLAGAALATMFLLSRRRLRAPLCGRIVVTTRLARPTEARQNGPPATCAFSVIRC